MRAVRDAGTVPDVRRGDRAGADSESLHRFHEPCAGSVLNLLDEKGFNHQVETEEGLLGEECSMMLKEFFKELREKRKKKKEEKAGE